ncbi:hypothetical protein LAZ67_5000886, partial [Cordylochernes scorpioides]
MDPGGKPSMARAESPLKAEQKPVRHGLKAQLCAEISANQDLQKKTPIVLTKNQNYVNLPAGGQDANSAAPFELAAIPPSNAASQVRRNWADMTEDVSPGSENGFTLVRSRKRRRGPAVSPTPAPHSSNTRGAEATRRPRSTTGSVPRAEEIKITRAHIAEARARQASSAEDNYVYVEYSPELEPFHYLRAVDRMVGGASSVAQIAKINGHYLLGLVNRGLAERLISEGLEIEGTLLRAFPFRRRAVRITLGNLPLFVEDSAISSALAPYGRVTSIAPKLMKAGPYIYNDGRREAFIALHEGVTTERLPTRLEIKIKGEVWPAYLSYGIKCSRCHGQGHRRANCPLLTGRSNAPGPATPTSPTGVPPVTAPRLPQPPSAQPPPPASPSPAMEVSDVPSTSRAALHPPAALRQSPPVAPAVPTEMAPPASPPVTPAPFLRAPGSHEPAVPIPDIEMSIIEETSTSSTSSSKTSTREGLVTFIERNPGVSFAQTDALGLGREEVLDILSSKTKARKRGPLLSPQQGDALAGLIRQLLGQRPGGSSNIYKVLGQVRTALKTSPAAVPPAPPLPAPRPAEPAPPVPHGVETKPAMATPPPPLPTPMEEVDHEELMEDLFEELSSDTELKPLLDSGFSTYDLICAILYRGERALLIPQLSPSQKIIFAGFIDTRADRMNKDKNQTPSGVDQIDERVELPSATITLENLVTQLTIALQNLRPKARQDIEMPKYDGTYPAQSFFETYDNQADRAGLSASEKLDRLPLFLVQQPLQYFHQLRLDTRNYFQARHTLLDLYPSTSEVTYSKYFALRLQDQSLEEYYRTKTAMGLQLGLPQETILETLTEGLPFGDQQLVRIIPPTSLTEWYGRVTRIREYTQPTTRQASSGPPYISGPYTSTQRFQPRSSHGANSLPSSPCRYCGQNHCNKQCRKQPFAANNTLLHQIQTPEQRSSLRDAQIHPIEQAITKPIATPQIFHVAPSQVPIEQTSQVQIEQTSQVPIAQTSQVPIEQTSQVPIEQTSQVPIEQTSQVPIEQTSQVPIELTSQVPIEQTSQVPIEQTSQIPIAQTSQVPIEQTSQVPIEQTSQVPIEHTSQVPIEQTSQVPIEQTSQVQIEQTSQVRIEQTSQVPIAHTSQEPTTPDLHELTVEDEMSKNPQHDHRLLLEDTDLSDSSMPDKRDSPSLSERCYESFGDCEHPDSIRVMQNPTGTISSNIAVPCQSTPPRADQAAYVPRTRLHAIGRMSLEATNLVWAGSPHRAEHEPGNLGSDNQAVAELSAETHFQEETSRIANASGNYANLPIDRKHANFAAACVADVTPSTSGALTAATNWAEQMEASETDEDGFTVVKHKRRRRESPSRPVEQRSSGVATSRRTGPTPRRRPPAGGATGVQMIRATRADIADARARQRSSTEDNCVFVEHCPDFGSTHYLQAVEELVGGAGNVLQVMKMDGHMLVGLSTKALAERLIRDGLDIGHTHLRAFPFKKRAERITVGNLPFFVDDDAVIKALKPYGDVTSIVPIRLRAGRYTFTDGRREAFILLKEGIALEKIPTRVIIQNKGNVLSAFISYGVKCSRCGRQGHRRANCPIIPGRASNNAQPQPAPPPSGASSTESRQLNRPTPTAPAPSPKRPAPQTSAPGTSAALPARTSSDAVAPSSEPMEIAAEVLASSTSNSAPQAVKPMEAPEAPADLRPPASQPAGVVPQAQPASVAPPGPLHAHGTPVPPSPSSSERKTRPDLEAYLKRNPGVSFAETDALGLGREEVLDILSSKTRAHKRGQHLTLPQSNALAGLIYQILDLRPGGDSNIYKVLRQVLSELRTAPTAVPSTPPLPAPRPAGPTPPVPHEEETTPTAMRPSPPLEPTIEDDMIVEIFTKLDHTTSLRPIYEAGINPVVLRNVVLYAESPGSAGQKPGRPSIPSPIGGKNSTKEESYKEISRDNSENQEYANPPTGVGNANLAVARGDITSGLPPATSANGATRALRNWADCPEDQGPGADDDFTVVRTKKRRRESANSPIAAAPSSNIGGARTSRRPQSSAGSVPRAQEVRTTRAHITEARARQTSSSEDHCVYLEHGPELQPFHYLRALDRMLGGTAGVIQVSKVNGHQLLGLANRGLAERLINEGLEVEGTLLRAFPFRKRAERITVGNLPFFVEDSAIISALKPYGRVTSIAPKLMKAGPYTYNDGRREAFIVLREGMTIERLPTRLEIPIKGEAWPAYLSSGIKCSRCHGQGHRRANCPLLVGRANNSRLAPPTSPAGVPSTTTSAPPQRSAAQPPAPAPSSTAMEIPGASHAARAVTPSAAPRPSTPVASAVPMEMAPPAPPPVTPAPSLRAPGSHEPAAPTPDIEMSIVEKTSTSSTSSSKTSTREGLVTFIERNPGISFAQTDALGLGREEVLDILSSKTKARKRGPLLSPSQCGALAGLIRQLLCQRPGGDSNIYKVLRQVLSELRTAPTAVPSTPTLPAPRPSGPTPPTSHSEELMPAVMTPPPPAPTEMEEDNPMTEKERCAPPPPAPRLAEPTPPTPHGEEITPAMATPPPPLPFLTQVELETKVSHIGICVQMPLDLSSLSEEELKREQKRRKAKEK